MRVHRDYLDTEFRVFENGGALPQEIRSSNT